MAIAEPIEKAIKEFSKLPGIGKKSALRIVYHLLNEDKKAIEDIENVLILLKTQIERCPECRGYKEVGSECLFCSDPKRDKSTICIVESTSDMHLVDSTSSLRCSFFVLNGLLSPIKGVTPESLRMNDLMEIIKKNDVKEIIMATPYTAEGETTVSFILSLVSGKEIKVSRIGMGIPIGSELSYIDSETLSRALNYRRVIK